MTKKTKKGISRNSKKGFTLIELIVVICILSALTALAMPAMVGLISKAEAEACHTNLSSFRRAYMQYRATEDLTQDQCMEKAADEINVIKTGNTSFTDKDGQVCTVEFDETGYISNITCPKHGELERGNME
ncbi:MAG: type II secretion system protein [Firmicutes bacterium]|nr:type II secretion system protein [Bacillota bacterium]